MWQVELPDSARTRERRQSHREGQKGTKIKKGRPCGYRLLRRFVPKMFELHERAAAILHRRARPDIQQLREGREDRHPRRLFHENCRGRRLRLESSIETPA